MKRFLLLLIISYMTGLSACLSCRPVHTGVSPIETIRMIDSMGIHHQNITSDIIKRYIMQNQHDADMIYEFCKDAEDYFYNPNSLHRNDELYYYIIKAVRSHYQENIKFQHFTNQLKLLEKNRINNKAEDFTYTLKDGTRHQLYDIPSAYIIIFFNNPDCEGCRQVRHILEYAQPVSDLCQSGILTVLALFPDEDISIWKKAEYPRLWLNAYDDGCQILKNNIYDLKASPTLYLLDKDKKVLLKDADVNEVIDYLIAKCYITKKLLKS
jgi:hypothetical protein